MTQGAKIVYTDFNTMQKKVSVVLGVGGVNSSGTADVSYGYGQSVNSMPVSQYDRMSLNQWTLLRTDLLNTRRYQIGDAATLPVIDNTTIISESIRQAFSTMADAVVTDRLTASPTCQTAGDLSIQTYSASWTQNIEQTVTITFSNATAMRYFFNSGGTITMNASRVTPTGKPSTAKDGPWTTFLSDVGTVSFGRSSTTSTDGTINIGILQLIQLQQGVNNAPQTIYTKTRTVANVVTASYYVTAILSSDKQLVIKVVLLDDSSVNSGIVVTGLLTSNVRAVYANKYVILTPPTATDVWYVYSQVGSAVVSSVAGDKKITYSWPVVAAPDNNTTVSYEVYLITGSDEGALTTNTTYTTQTGTSVTAAATYGTTLAPLASTSSASGYGATFIVTKTGSGLTYTSSNTTITLVNPGAGYALNDTITILGSVLGGADVTNNLTFTVATAIATKVSVTPTVTTTTVTYVATPLPVNSTYTISVIVNMTGGHLPSLPAYKTDTTWDIVPTPVITATGSGGAGAVTFTTTNSNTYAVKLYYQTSTDGSTWSTEQSYDLASNASWTLTIGPLGGSVTRYARGRFTTTANYTNSLLSSPVSAASYSVFTPTPTVTAVGGNGSVTFSSVNSTTYDVNVLYEIGTDGTSFPTTGSDAVAAGATWTKTIASLGNSITRYCRVRYDNSSFTTSAYSTPTTSGTSWDKLSTPTISPTSGKYTITFRFTNNNTVPITLHYAIVQSDTQPMWAAATWDATQTINNGGYYDKVLSGLPDDTIRYVKCYATAANKVDSDQTNPAVSGSSFGTLATPGVSAQAASKAVNFSVTNSNSVAVDLYYMFSADGSTWGSTYTKHTTQLAATTGNVTVVNSPLADTTVSYFKGHFSATNWNDSPDTASPYPHATSFTTLPKPTNITQDVPGYATKIIYNWARPSSGIGQNITSYDYYIGGTLTGNTAVDSSGNATYTTGTLTQGTIQQFKVVAKAPYFNDSPASDVFSGYTLAATPAKPTFDQLGQFHLRVNWTAITGVTGYTLWAKIGVNGAYQSAGTTTSTNIVLDYTSAFPVTENTDYYFYVQATNPAGSSPSGTTEGNYDHQLMLRAPQNPLGSNSTATGSITYPKDYANYLVTSPTYGKSEYTFTLTNTSGTMVPFITLYDYNLTSNKATNTASSSSSNAIIKYTLETKTSYYVQVAGSNITTGTYSISSSLAVAAVVTSITVSKITTTGATFDFTVPTTGYDKITAYIMVGSTNYTAVDTNGSGPITVTGVPSTTTTATAKIVTTNAAGDGTKNVDVTTYAAVAVTGIVISNLTATSFDIAIDFVAKNVNVQATYYYGSSTPQLSKQSTVTLNAAGTAYATALQITGVPTGTTGGTLSLVSSNLFGSASASATLSPTAVTSPTIDAYTATTIKYSFTAGSNTTKYIVSVAYSGGSGTSPVTNSGTSSPITVTYPLGAQITSTTITSQNLFSSVDNTTVPIPLFVTFGSGTTAAAGTVKWTWTSTGATSYDVSFNGATAVNQTDAFLEKTSLSNGTAYTITVVAKADSKTSSLVTAGPTLTTWAKLATPVITATEASGKVTFTWPNVTDASAYRCVLNGDTANGFNIAKPSSGVPTKEVTVAANTSVTIDVYAFGTSKVISDTATKTAASLPIQVTAYTLAARDNVSATVNWTDVACTTYKIYFGVYGSTLTLVETRTAPTQLGSTSGKDFTSLTPDTQYTVRVDSISISGTTVTGTTTSFYTDITLGSIVVQAYSQTDISMGMAWSWLQAPVGTISDFEVEVYAGTSSTAVQTLTKIITGDISIQSLTPKTNYVLKLYGNTHAGRRYIQVVNTNTMPQTIIDVGMLGSSSTNTMTVDSLSYVPVKTIQVIIKGGGGGGGGSTTSYAGGKGGSGTIATGYAAASLTTTYSWNTPAISLGGAAATTASGGTGIAGGTITFSAGSTVIGKGVGGAGGKGASTTAAGANGADATTGVAASANGKVGTVTAGGGAGGTGGAAGKNAGGNGGAPSIEIRFLP